MARQGYPNRRTNLQGLPQWHEGRKTAFLTPRYLVQVANSLLSQHYQELQSANVLTLKELSWGARIILQAKCCKPKKLLH